LEYGIIASPVEGSDQIPAEMIEAGGEILLSTRSINSLIIVNYVWNKEELPD
jgi:hypothetical protein